jgi:sodium/proline symporter
MTDHTIVLFVFALYLGLMLWMGMIGYRRSHTLLDYLLGGRRLGAFVTALSAGASDMSGWLLMGLPGAVFAAGMSEAWIAVGLLTGTYLNWLLVAKPLRRESERLKAITLSDYFAFRFRDRRHSLRLITALVILFFFMIYTTSGLVAGGKLFQAVFGIDYRLAVFIGALAIIVYTSMGGFVAVCLTDAVQGMLMIAALVVVPLMAAEAVGGWSACLRNIQSNCPEFLSVFSKKAGSMPTMGLVSTLGWGLGYFGMPHILVRFMAIESEARIPRARRIAVTWSAVCLAASIGVGFTGVAYFHQQGLADSEKVFIHLIQHLFHPVLAGLCLAAVLAAIMSTADSQILICTSVITEDIYRTFVKRQAAEKELVRIGRATAVAIAMVAAFMALDPESRVMGLVSYAWAGFGAAFGPAILLSLYWRGMSGAGAIAGIVGGGLTVALWKNLSGGLFDLYEIFPGFLVSTALIAFFSRRFPSQEQHEGIR